MLHATLSAMMVVMPAAGPDLSAAAAQAETPLHQKVTVEYRGREPGEVLKDLGGKAGVTFVCPQDLLERAGPVTYVVKDQEAGRVATRILRPRGMHIGKVEGDLVTVEKLDPMDELKVKRAEVFEFAERPTVTRAGDKVTIRFATTDFCDATVAIEEDDGRTGTGTISEKNIGNGASPRSPGKIIRFLASGVLGENAPEPFLWNSKRQELIWDGKNEQGVYVDDKEKIVVRVSLGLKPQFERTLYWSAKKRTFRLAPLICAAPEGVFVQYKGPFDHLRQFDHAGNYVRTVYPFAADKLKGLEGLQWAVFPQDGQRLPVKQRAGPAYSTLLQPPPKGAASAADRAARPMTVAEHQLAEAQAGVDAGSRAWAAMAIHGTRLARFEGRLIRLTTSGTTDGPSPWGPDVTLGLRAIPGANQGTGPNSAAFSPDGKWVYLTGYRQELIYGADWFNGVARMAYDGSAPPEVFAGKLNIKESGSGPGEFNMPVSVACDSAGRVYVADSLNDRIQVLSPEGKHLKDIPVRRPVKVVIHRKTQDIYVFSWFVHPSGNYYLWGKTWGKVDAPVVITHLGAFDNPRQVAAYTLPFEPPNQTATISPNFQAEVDPWTEPTTIWLTMLSAGCEDAKWRGPGTLMVYAEEPGKRQLTLKRDFSLEAEKEAVRIWAYRTRMRMAFNPVSGDLYHYEIDVPPKNFRSAVVIDPRTGRVRIEKLPFAAEDMAFDLDGQAYLRTECDMVRYNSKTWEEVPFDYGEQRDKIGQAYPTPHEVTGDLVMPGFLNGCFHLGGMSISPKGHIVVSCFNPAKLPKIVVGRGDPGAEGVVQHGIKPYTAKLFPGGARGCQVHVFDKYGRILYDDALPGIGWGAAGPGSAAVGTFGVFMDRDDNLYVLYEGARCYDGKPYLSEYGMSGGGCTLIKARPKVAKIISRGAAEIPIGDAAPKRPVDVGGGNLPLPAWVEGAEWLYGGAGNVGNGCSCLDCRPTLDYFARAFVPEMEHYTVGVLDTNGNLMLRIGRYGNVDDGMPLVKPGGPENPRSVGGDEVALFNPAYLATDTDRRLFIGDNGNGRILSVQLGYHTEGRVALKDVPDRSTAK